MKNANVMIALVLGLVLGLVIGRMTVQPDADPTRPPKGPEPGTADTSETARSAASTEHELFNADIEKGWFKGSDEPLVTIVEFSDFACGFCGRAQATLDQLLKDYEGKLRIVAMHMPMRNPGHIAAQAAEAAGAQGKFWEYRAKLFENPRALDRASLERFAGELGLDVPRMRRELDDEMHKEKVDAHVQSGRAVGVRGTPYFFINGRLLRGAQPLDEFKKVIDEEIERANRVLAAGVSQENLYATLVAHGEEAREAKQRAEARQERPEVERRQPSRPEFGRPDITNAHGHGPNDALVTIVEYSNIQCGFCARVRPTIARIKEEYGDDVRVFYKDNTRPGPGHLVAQAGEAAGEQGRLFEFMDRVFENRRNTDRDALERHAAELGLDMARFRAALDENKFAARVDEHTREAMSLGARGTPSFFINGRYLAGAQPFDNFKKIIDEEIEKANKLIDAGTRRQDLYAQILEENEKEFGGEQARAPTPPVRPSIQDRIQDRVRPARDVQKADATARQQEPAQQDRQDIDISTAALKGSPDAPVTIVEFSSFTCGFCARVQPTLEQLLREYDGQVRLAFMHRATGDRASLAAQATMAAKEQGKFWEYQAKLFANMRAIERDDLERYAQELGLDIRRFRIALDEGKFADVVNQQSQIALRAGARGTPTFFINGRRLVGAQPIDKFKEIIDDELKQGS